MTKLHKAYWVVHNIANALSPAVTALYWTTVYNSECINSQVSTSSWPTENRVTDQGRILEIYATLDVKIIEIINSALTFLNRNLNVE